MVDILHMRRAVIVVVLGVVAPHRRRADPGGVVAFVDGLLPTDPPMSRTAVPEAVATHLQVLGPRAPVVERRDHIASGVDVITDDVQVATA